MFPVLYEVDAFTVAATTPVVSGVGTMGTGGTLYPPPSSGLVPRVPPKSKMRLMSKF